MKTKRLPASEHDKYNLSEYPNFSASGSIYGMKNTYYGEDALLVRCGGYTYNVTSDPEIWEAAE